MATVNIKTNFGKISFKLLPELAPETVEILKNWPKKDSMMELYSTELFLDL